MRLTHALCALVTIIPVLGVPTRVPITKRAGPVKPNSYIITFIDSASKNAFVGSKPSFTQPQSTINDDWTVLPAISAKLFGSDVAFVQSAPGIKLIELDGLVSVFYEHGIDGFDPIGYRAATEAPQLRNCTESSSGEGVDIYGIDTGIYTDHSCFGGRAVWGAVFGGYEQKDGNGHGTHTAGTAAGRGYGTAPGAKVIAVKVLSDDGSGATSDVISGVNYVSSKAQESGNPSVATMSLGGSISSALDMAVSNAIAQGVHFTIAAGNSNVMASLSSPARVPEANTIGAVDSSNEKAEFSNWGKRIDVWAPGVDIKSAWIGSPDAENTISGTSMATPFVAGYVAILLSMHGSMTPAKLSDMIKANAIPEAVTFKRALNVPAGLSSTKMLFNCARPQGSY